MTRKEKIDLLLSKVSEEKKGEFVAEFRKAVTKEARMETLKKYEIDLTEEEAAALFKKTAKELDVHELEQIAGGCTCFCGCGFDG